MGANLDERRRKLIKEMPWRISQDIQKGIADRMV
jgi:hypothetical protein